MPCYEPPYNEDLDKGAQAMWRNDRYIAILKEIEGACHEVLNHDRYFGGTPSPQRLLAQSILDIIDSHWKSQT